MPSDLTYYYNGKEYVKSIDPRVQQGADYLGISLDDSARMLGYPSADEAFISNEADRRKNDIWKFGALMVAAPAIASGIGSLAGAGAGGGAAAAPTLTAPAMSAGLPGMTLGATLAAPAGVGMAAPALAAPMMSSALPGMVSGATLSGPSASLAGNLYNGVKMANNVYNSGSQVRNYFGNTPTQPGSMTSGAMNGVSFVPNSYGPAPTLASAGVPNMGAALPMSAGSGTMDFIRRQISNAFTPQNATQGSQPNQNPWISALGSIGRFLGGNLGQSLVSGGLDVMNNRQRGQAIDKASGIIDKSVTDANNLLGQTTQQGLDIYADMHNRNQALYQPFINTGNASIGELSRLMGVNQGGNFAPAQAPKVAMPGGGAPPMGAVGQPGGVPPQHVRMQSPSGQMVYVPQAQAAEALRNGGKVVQ